MAQVVIRQGTQETRVSAKPGMRLAEVLAVSGVMVAHPCGGRGVCGKCAVALSGAVSAPNEHERRAGTRLSCQAVIEGDAQVILPQAQPMEQIEAGGALALEALHPMPGHLGAAVDIGTTTLALRLYDLQDGRCIGVSTMLNPQTSVAADVIGRMDAALKGAGESLRQQITAAVQTLLHHACAQAQVAAAQVESLTLTGNTTMLYLLCGRDPQSLSHAPFQADHAFDEEIMLLGRRGYLPRCMHAFVGADITCAVLASGMCQKGATALLCDMGTNGEVALWHRDTLYVTSTAAGPAFEGAGISCGCGSIPGAIDRVDVFASRLQIHTIAHAAPVGVCGSGLISAVANLLELGMLDETGLLEETAVLAQGVTLTQQDMRAVQLAKAAVAAGMHCLMARANCRAEEVQTLYLAGGFGSHLSIPHAVRIGLIPAAMAGRVKIIGNAALDGAALLLLDQTRRRDATRLADAAQHVDLGGDPVFNQRYVEEMFFPAGEEDE